MNIEKAELKMLLAQQFARDLEELETGTKRDVHRLEGTLSALKQAATALDGHRAYYQEQTDNDELTGPECTLAMRVISRCVGGLQNLQDKSQLALTLKQGELQGMRRSIDALEKTFTAEAAKVRAVADMIERDGRPDGAAADIQRRREAANQGEEKMGAMPKPKGAGKAGGKSKKTKKDGCKGKKKKGK